MAVTSNSTNTPAPTSFGLDRRAMLGRIPIAALATTTVLPAAAFAITTDPVFAQIERHRHLRACVNALPDDNDPVYQAACREEEAAIQMLGGIVPTSLRGAAEMLKYMAEVEGDFVDEMSPFVRAVRSVAAGLTSL